MRKLLLLDAQLLGAGPAAQHATDNILDARPDREMAVENYRKYSHETINTDDEFGATLISFLSLYTACPDRDLDGVAATFTNLS